MNHLLSKNRLNNQKGRLIKEKSTKIAPVFIQNKANLSVDKFGAKHFSTRIYERFYPLGGEKNKPNQTQFKPDSNPIPERPEMNLRDDIIMNYKDFVPMLSKKQTQTNPIQTQFKLVAYHGHELGELFDLSKDPTEFDSLWDRLYCEEKRLILLKCCFDAAIHACNLQMPLVKSQSDISALSGLKEGESVRHVGLAPTEGTGWKTVFESESYSMAVDRMGEGLKLFDLTKDSGRKSNIWGDSNYRKVRSDLLKKCFDATVFVIDTGPQRVGCY